MIRLCLVFIFASVITARAADLELPAWEVLYQQLGGASGLVLYAGPFYSKKGLDKAAAECENLMQSKCLILPKGKRPKLKRRKR